MAALVDKREYKCVFRVSVRRALEKILYVIAERAYRATIRRVYFVRTNRSLTRINQRELQRCESKSVARFVRSRRYLQADK